MSEPIDLDFLEQKKYEAIRLEEHLDCTDHWAKPFYSNVYIFKPEVERVFIGLNPGGNRHSKKYYKKYKYEKRIWSKDELLFNSYLDERWGDEPSGAQRKGEDRLQIAVQQVFKTMYGPDWKATLRNTPCFNLIPVSTKDASDSKLDKIWVNGVEWSVELLEYLKPKFIVLYGNGRKKDDKSVWRALEQNLHLIDCCPRIDVTKTFKIYTGVIPKGTLKGTPVLGLPHLSRIHPSNKRTSKNLSTLCKRLGESASLRPFL